MQNVYATTTASQARKYSLCTVLSILFFAVTNITNAQVVINPRSNIVLNGNVSLVVNNVGFVNNGTFKANTGNVNFIGHKDTLASYISGTKTTTFYNLSVRKSAYGIALKSPVAVKNVLTVSGGNLYTDSNLTLRSDANLTARVGVVTTGSNIIGKTNVERYVPARRAWRLMTAPVSNSNSIFNSWQNHGLATPGAGTFVTGPNPTGAAGNGLDASAANSVSLKKWNVATQVLTAVTNTMVPISQGTSENGNNTAYFIFIRGDRDPSNTSATSSNTTTLTSTGTLQTGTQTFTGSNAYDKFSLVGNPYASPVDFNNVTITNLVKRFYVWDPTINALGGYVMLDDLDNDGVFVKNVAASAQTKEIQSGQAFFVLNNANATSTITFNEGSKSVNNNNLVFRPESGDSQTGSGTGLISAGLFLLNNDSTTLIADGVIAEFNNVYAETINQDDALKFSNTNENIGIVRNNTMLAAERRPVAGLNDTIFFRITKTVQRNYQLVLDTKDLDQVGMVAYLEDSYLHTSTLITLAGKTKINFFSDGTNSTASANRFMIVFKPAMLVLPVTIQRVSAYKKNNNIAVEWKVENELNIVKYDVERSADGSSFVKMHTTTVTGAYNASNVYNWQDENAIKGNNFYRIKVYDRSGEVKYSSIVKVATEKSNAGFSIYPNPVTGTTINLVMNNKTSGIYHVTLTGTTGQIIFTKSIQHNGGNASQALSTGTKLAAGIYQLEIIDQDNSHNTQKVIVE